MVTHWKKGLGSRAYTRSMSLFFLTWIVYHILGGMPGIANYLWGGFLSCLSEFALFGGIWHMVNCHEKGCPRWGHMVNGTRVCHKHRKNLKMTPVGPVVQLDKLPPVE